METLNKPKPMRLHLILNILEKDQCFISTKKKRERDKYKYRMVMGKIL